MGEKKTAQLVETENRWVRGLEGQRERERNRNIERKREKKKEREKVLKS